MNTYSTIGCFMVPGGPTRSVQNPKQIRCFIVFFIGIVRSIRSPPIKHQHTDSQPVQSSKQHQQMLDRSLLYLIKFNLASSILL
jgi:hypothetical protein